MRYRSLHRAVQHKNRIAVKILLDAGARIDCGDPNGRTPLHYAAANASQDIVKLLLSRGAALDARDNFGILAGAPGGNTEMVDFLADVRAAGGWRKYTLAPRVRLLALHKALPALQSARRATVASVPVHEAIFASDALPKELVWKVLSYWRSDRDLPVPGPAAPLDTFWANQPDALRLTVPFPVGGAAF